MKICGTHWTELRAAIHMRGLSPFISEDGSTAFISQGGAAAAEAIKEHANRADPTKPYDPMMSANFTIWSQALECGGAYLVMDAELCPLCELEAKTPAKASDWINPCCDALLKDFRKQGWLPSPN